jgi:ABC-type lipoprotein release transport system permease subunit
MALGAQRRNVLGLVLGEGMRLAAIGVVIGGAGAAIATRWLRAQLYEVSATDPATFVTAAVVLAGVAALATLVPAWRATGIDPVGTLKAE